MYGYIRRHHLQFGTYAEYATTPEGFFAHMPPELSFEEAYALPLTSLTAHQALEALGLRGGETLFLTGGAGGIGHVVIQLAVARGARVVATASGRNHDFDELGAEPLDYADDNVPGRVHDLLDDSEPTPRSTCSAATSVSRPSPHCAERAGSPRSPSRRRRPARATRSPTSSCGRAASTSASASRRWWPRAASARP